MIKKKKIAMSAKKKGANKLVTYHVNCDCCSYDWTRYPTKGKFMRCRGCHRLLGDMDVSVVTLNEKKYR